MKLFEIILLGLGFAFVGSASAHDGVLDSYGCHRNVAHGSYHCHRGPLAGKQYRTKADMVRILNERENRLRPKPAVTPSRYRR
jgi:hypothetical protein